jgi:hypothetical protein
MISLHAGFNHDARTDRHDMNGPGDFDHETAHADDAPIGLDIVKFQNLLGQCLHAATGVRVNRVS